MIRNWLRTILALLLLMTVANKTQVSTNLSHDKVASKVVKVLAEHRLSAQSIPPTRDLLPAAVHFQAPGCDGTIEVIPIHINLQEAPLFRLVKANYTRQFAYLDKT